jgi:D-3-phosphoglycerate dehydrogenase
MTDTVESLVLDLLDWLSRRDRSYEETMEAWRTSCPKLPVWEDANERGLVCVEYNQSYSSVRVTAAGAELLHQCRPQSSLRRAAR